MKRKLLAILLSLSLCICLFSGMAFAGDEEADAAPVAEAEEIPDEEGLAFVSINATVAVAGELVLADYPVFVHDEDEDGEYTVYDALVSVHGMYYLEDDGGFAVSDEGFITKLWGVENGGSYGYYLNGVMCYSLMDPVAESDYLVAFAYADTEAWSDMFTTFDSDEVDAQYGEEITLTLTGVVFDEEWNPVSVPLEGAVITINGVETEFATDAEGRVTFVIPGDLAADDNDDYTISAVLGETVIVPPAATVYLSAPDEPEPETAFTDIAGHWAESYIKKAAGNSYLNGVSETAFAPDANVSRAMLATVLYRVFGEPETEGENVFSDVEEGKWYTDAVIWAAENEIVRGSDGAFRPDDDLTRSEAAAILHRWMKIYVDRSCAFRAAMDTADAVQELYPDRAFDSPEEIFAAIGENEELTAAYEESYAGFMEEMASRLLPVDEDMLKGFADADAIPAWAKEDMAWAVASGILTGISETAVAPLMTLSRAQLAVILARALEL